jgi:hypothetical protein
LRHYTHALEPLARDLQKRERDYKGQKTNQEEQLPCPKSVTFDALSPIGPEG